jgi:hypothetical protein
LPLAAPRSLPSEPALSAQSTRRLQGPSQTNQSQLSDGRRTQHKYNMKAVVQIYNTTAELRQTTRRLCQRQSDGIRRSAGGGLCCATLNDRVRNLKMEWANSKMQRAACTATHNMHAQRTAPASTHAVQICTMWCRACSMSHTPGARMMRRAQTCACVCAVAHSDGLYAAEYAVPRARAGIDAHRARPDGRRNHPQR